MKNLSFYFILFLLGNFCYSQGGWDIGYVAIDKIDQGLIGKDVKLDFKNQKDSLDTIPRFLMNFIAIEDSVKIFLAGEEIELREKRNIHCDWGFYNEQYLEYSNFNKSEMTRIYHTIIEELTNDSIFVRLYTEVYNKNVKRKAYHGRRSYLKEWIPKDKLKGVMIKNETH